MKIRKLTEQNLIEQGHYILTEAEKEPQLPELTGANINSLLNSKEFKKPVSEDEAEAYLAASSEEPSLDSAEEVDEAVINSCINEYLTEAYTNVSDFAVSSCRIRGTKLFIEGKVTFKNGKVKRTLFEFKEANKNILTGTNRGIAESAKFLLAYHIANKKLLVERLKYSYKTANNSLVEGLSRHYN